MRVIIHGKNAKLLYGLGFTFQVNRYVLFIENRQMNDERRSLINLAGDVDRSAVTPNNSVTHRQSKARAVFAFGRKKWFQAFRRGFFGHSSPAVGNFEPNTVTA